MISALSQLWSWLVRLIFIMKVPCRLSSCHISNTTLQKLNLLKFNNKEREEEREINFLILRDILKILFFNLNNLGIQENIFYKLNFNTRTEMTFCRLYFLFEKWNLCRINIWFPLHLYSTPLSTSSILLDIFENKVKITIVTRSSKWRVKLF